MLKLPKLYTIPAILLLIDIALTRASDIKLAIIRVILADNFLLGLKKSDLKLIEQLLYHKVLVFVAAE